MSNPANEDTDGDGLNDMEEVDWISDLNTADTDGDGLNDKEEFDLQTDPTNTDTDGDSLTDGDEVNTQGTDPLLIDTDGDSLTDGDEVNTHGSDPTLIDTDAGGVADGQEVALGTDPLNPADDVTEIGRYRGGCANCSSTGTSGLGWLMVLGLIPLMRRRR